MPYSLKPLPCLHLMAIATIAAFVAAGLPPPIRRS